MRVVDKGCWEGGGREGGTAGRRGAGRRGAGAGGGLGRGGGRVGKVEGDGRDAKTALQEWAQAQGYGLPSYSVAGRTGPDHAPRFTIEVRVTEDLNALAEGTSKRKAEQDAARALLERLNT